MALKQLFFQKITKNRPAAGGFAAKPWPVIPFNFSTLLYSTRLPIQTFSHIDYWFTLLVYYWTIGLRSCNSIITLAEILSETHKNFI